MPSALPPLGVAIPRLSLLFLCPREATLFSHILNVNAPRQVKGIIAEQLGVELDSVVPGASFTEDLGADSLDAVELIMAIEEAFDIEIPDEEAETMTTPADCVTAIKAKL